MLNALLDDPSKDNERARNTERRSDVRKQLNEELQNLEERFAKYLQLGH
jgi:hypothetical protein